MAVTKITWENKTGIQNDASVARKNKVVDEDMNEIKQVVNNNADEVTTMQETIEDLQEGQGTASTDITNLKNRVSTLETDNTKNKSDISKLKTDNETNKLNISELQKQFSNFENYDDTEIKQDIEDIKQEQEEQNANIENLQTNDNKQDELISKLKNALINVETEESKSLYVTDANKFGSLEVLGNHEQDEEPSPDYPSEVKCLGSNKNILDTSLIQETTKGGITSKINSDGSITFNGTCTVDNNVFDFYVENTTKFMFDAIKDQTTISAFYISGSIKDENNEGCMFRINNNSYSSNYIDLTKLSAEKIITRTYNNTSGSVFCDIRIDKNVVLDNFTIKLKAANTLEDALTYSPYGQGSTKISKINKNLFNKETAIQGLLEGDGSLSYSDSRYYTSDFIQVIPGQTYYKTYSGSSRFKFFDKNKNPISNTYNDLTDPTGAQSFEIPENAHYIRFTFLQTSLDSIQIEKSSDGTEYVEHQQTDYLLYIQREMLKGDYFVKEKDGWKEVHNWNKLILTGDESYNNNVNYINIGRFGIYLELPAKLGSITNPNAISNYYKSEFAVENGNVYVSGVDGVVYMINENFKGDLEGFKQQLRLYYQENKPVYIYYVLKTPTKLPCTEEQSAVLEELSNLDLFEGVNNIITAEDIALLKLKYALDVETYVDNKIEEKLANINQQILEIVGGN